MAAWSWAFRLVVAFVVAQSLILFAWFGFPSDSWPARPRSQEGPPARTVVIYNRIPKTGSTSLMQVPYKLSRQRRDFSVVFVNHTSGKGHNNLFSLEEQIWFVRNISSWRSELPALYHGHFAFVDFASGLPSGARVPADFVYINMIRDPIDRMVSYYYFLRYGDDYRSDRIRSRMGDKMSLDECIDNGHPDCDPSSKMWLQVPYFCGHSPHCWSPPGNRWALERAKANLVDKYLLVGVTELIEEFAGVLSAVLPQFFSSGDKAVKLPHIRKTQHKDDVSEDTLKHLRSHSVWKVEDEFYRFARTHFVSLKDSVLKLGKTQGRTFSYMKVAPSDLRLV